MDTKTDRTKHVSGSFLESGPRDGDIDVHGVGALSDAVQQLESGVQAAEEVKRLYRFSNRPVLSVMRMR